MTYTDVMATLEAKRERIIALHAVTCVGHMLHAGVRPPASQLGFVRVVDNR